jgi:hypothetical protein
MMKPPVKAPESATKRHFSEFLYGQREGVKDYLMNRPADG